MKEELLGYRFLVRWREISKYPRDVSEGEDFRQYPCRRIRIGVRVLEVYDKVLSRVSVFALYEGQRSGVDIGGIGHPEYVPGHVRNGVHDGGTKCDLDLLNLVEEQHSQFLVKTIEPEHTVKRDSLFILVCGLWLGKKGIHIRAQPIVADVVNVTLCTCFVGDGEASLFKLFHQVCRRLGRFVISYHIE